MTTPEPTPPDSWAILDGLAQHLHDAGVARYNPTGIYEGEGLPAVFFGQLPDKPDTALLLNLYNVDHQRDDGSPDYYIQIRHRTTGRHPKTTEDQADAVFRLLHDTSHQVWSSVKVLLCRRIIRAPISPDNNNRYTRPDSYRITANPNQP